jgi:hypothetical protein
MLAYIKYAALRVSPQPPQLTHHSAFSVGGFEGGLLPFFVVRGFNTNRLGV